MPKQVRFIIVSGWWSFFMKQGFLVRKGEIKEGSSPFYPALLAQCLTTLAPVTD